MMKNGAMLLGLLLAAVGARGHEDRPDAKLGIGTGEAKVQAEIAFAPVLHIQLGAGHEAKDAIALSLNEVRNYTEGITRIVDRHLEVFAIGTGYSVDVTASTSARSDEEAADLFRVFAIAILPQGKRVTIDDLNDITASMRGRYKGDAEGKKELDVTYRIRSIGDYNIQAFNDLLGKEGVSKPYSIDFTYSVTPL